MIKSSTIQKILSGAGLCVCLALPAAPIHAQAVAAAETDRTSTHTLKSCTETAVTIVGGFGTASFTIEVVDTNAERARGLMFVEHMETFAGMLFVYEKEQSVHFWMKNTLIPLDMIFVDQRGIIASIHENAVPHDLTPIFGGDRIFSVLEINAGVSARLGLKTGDILVHPAFAASAALPCDEDKS